MSEHTESFETMPVHKAIKVGSIVEVHYADDPENLTETIQLTGWHDEGKTGEAMAVSPSSPIGRAVFGKETGDTVSFKAPTGEMIAVTIVSVR